MKNVITIILLISLFTSCKQAEAPAEEAPITPISTFDSAFPKNNKRLSRILGDDLEIVTEFDTLKLKIISSKKDNLILNTISGDTLFLGIVCKYRDLYFLNEKLDDSTYYMSAIRIDGNLIYGLTNSLSQHLAVDEKIIKGNYRKLVKSISKDTTDIRLRIDKKELRKLFNSIINEIIPDTIVIHKKSDFESLVSKEIVNESKEDENDYDFKVYPNPAKEFVNIDLTKKNKAIFQFSDLNGRIISKGRLNNSTNKIDLNGHQPGIFVLTITYENGEQESQKVIIK